VIFFNPDNEEMLKKKKKAFAKDEKERDVKKLP
jgi:hypothetical protein